MYEQLPKQLRAYPYFSLWKYEQKDGRRTKVPKTVRGKYDAPKLVYRSTNTPFMQDDLDLCLMNVKI